MRIRTAVSYFATIGATLTIFAGCSGGAGLGPVAGNVAQTSIALTTQVRSIMFRGPRNLHGLVLPGSTPNRTVPVAAFVDAIALAQAPKEVVVSFLTNVVNVYNANTGAQLAQFTGFSAPESLASDLHGNLYIADYGNSRIVVYAHGFKSPPTIISDPGQLPAGVDSFGQGAYIGVTNDSTNFGPGSVNVYKGTTLLSTISSPVLGEAFFCAFDAKGDLYVDGVDERGGALVGVIANATSGGTTFTRLSHRNTITFPGNIQVTNDGKIAVLDQTAAIYTYNPPLRNSLGSPVTTTVLSGVLDPVNFALTKPGTELLTAGSGNTVKRFAYPAGGSATQVIGVGVLPIGVATIAAQTPEKK